MKKTHMTLDLYGVSESRFEVLFKMGSWYMLDSFITEIMREEGIKILNKMVHFFEGPVGAMTCLYLLSESHFSIHTFPEENGRIAVDLFTCGNNDVRKILMEIVSVLEPEKYVINTIEREDAL